MFGLCWKFDIFGGCLINITAAMFQIWSVRLLLKVIPICYYQARGVNMPMKQKNAHAGGRFLSLFFVIIRTFLLILILALAHIKSSRMCCSILGDVLDVLITVNKIKRPVVEDCLTELPISSMTNVSKIAFQISWGTIMQYLSDVGYVYTYPQGTCCNCNTTGPIVLQKRWEHFLFCLLWTLAVVHGDN